MTTPLGLPGHKYAQAMTPAEAGARIEVLKKLLNARLENKSGRNEGNAQCLRRLLKFSDLAGTNFLVHKQWLEAFERIGAQMSPADTELLFLAFSNESEPPAVDFHRFVEAMTSGVALGPLAGQDFVSKMAERHKAQPREGKRTYDDRVFNKAPPYALGEAEAYTAPRRVAEKTTNTPSQVGGIFAPAPPVVAPEHQSVKNFSTLSLAHAAWQPSEAGEEAVAFAPTVKRMSNTSSLPGGIFAAGTTGDFRVRGVFVRPGY